ncbi:ankyrin repeat domain-containing protein [Parashewanella curva]|uniref:Ankyrin repeat domain-containing protein n=1 Tax=Parashewanella curva TaxID=2338552 RepID=A0A3L8PV54_9GAMM|nr:ankyrin repeat domain-containing protein [Parashewanella curva]RLV59307.1 ankyrin repeat domain-containing protein [Parashewanella curva]
MASKASAPNAIDIPYFNRTIPTDAFSALGQLPIGQKFTIMLEHPDGSKSFQCTQVRECNALGLKVTKFIDTKAKKSRESKFKAIDYSVTLTPITKKDIETFITQFRLGMSTRSPELFVCCKEGNKADLETLIKSGINLNQKDEHGVTPLYYAYQNNHQGIIELLFQHGANPNITDPKGESIFLHIAEKGEVAIMRLFVQQSIPLQLNTKRASGEWTPLHLAAMHNSLEMFKIFMDAQTNKLAVTQSKRCIWHIVAENRDIHFLNVLIERKIRGGQSITVDGYTPLHLAAENGDFEVFKRLLSATNAPLLSVTQNIHCLWHLVVTRGAPRFIQLLINKNIAGIDWKDNNNSTPLLLAAQQGTLANLTLLCQSQLTSKNAKTKDQKSAWHFVARRNDPLLFDVVMKHHNVGHALEKDGKGWLPLHYATRYGSPEMFVKVLSISGTEYDALTNDQEALIHLAAYRTKAYFVQYLLPKGIGGHINALTKSGESALQLAVQKGSVETLNYLLQQSRLKKDIKTVKDSATVIHLAQQRSNTDIMKCLLADPSIKSLVNVANKHGHTPLHYCVANNRLEMLKLLISNGADVLITPKDGESLHAIAKRCKAPDCATYLATLDAFKRS